MQWLELNKREFILATDVVDNKVSFFVQFAEDIFDIKLILRDFVQHEKSFLKLILEGDILSCQLLSVVEESQQSVPVAEVYLNALGAVQVVSCVLVPDAEQGHIERCLLDDQEEVINCLALIVSYWDPILSEVKSEYFPEGVIGTSNFFF